MIELVIDKVFLTTFTDNINTIENKLHRDFVDFLEYSASPLILYTDIEKEETDQLKLNGKTNPLLEKLTNSKSVQIKNCNVKDLIYNESFLLNGSLFKFFFVSESESSCIYLRNKYGYEFICISNFEERWKYYYFNLKDRIELEMNVTSDVNIYPRFESWSEFRKFSHPLISFIIFDPFLLENKELIEPNIVNLLKVFLENLCSDQSIEIILITTDSKRGLPDKSWQEMYDLIYNSIKELLPNKTQFVLLKYPKNIPDHARGIFTNYWYIKSSSSFNYFDKRGKLTSVNDDIQFKMLFYKSTINFIQARISEIINFINKSKNEPARGILPAEQRIFSNTIINTDHEFKLVSSLMKFINP